MVLENLSESLRNTIKRIANAPYVDKKLIMEVVKDVQRAMLLADANVRLVLSLTKEIERRSLTEKPPAGMSSKEHVIRIVYDELVKIIGTSKDVQLKKQVIMMIGLYGQGKTTTCAKLAKYFQKKGLKPGLIASDVHRPAAYEQLTQLGKTVNVPVYGDPKEKNAVRVVKDGLKAMKERDVIIIDTSGRHALEPELIDEMQKISKAAEPDEKLLIVDATIGQQAGVQAKAFNDAVNITGVVISKLDGSAKGGGALSAVSATGAPILFIGTGEKTEDIEKFDPKRFISRILGMGDLQALLEKAEEVVDKEKAEKTARKIMSGKFTLKDMYEQMDMLTGMGPLKKIVDMLPFGMSGKLSDDKMKETQEKLKKFKIIMDSMNDEEMENPSIVKTSRVKRIALGSGCEPKDVKALLKYYNMSKRAVKGFAGNRRMKKSLMKSLKFTN
ncbi:MAG: signal recognition particle protein [Euryarchaeota archaeon CG01_land_8_20_14_3_00_38_12]|nr:MAG: signal recognition particle protein [Euryarchaeota archaeon CG01_land_8_20_14_3_00_38_12]PJB22314.1 MAG: signal recognition particle protein [Euryarchaeota archaeon CG_4_9_14_3_um_filter_38_12]